MHMADWIAKLDDFLRLSESNILTNAGRVSHQQAEEHAHSQYEIHEHQRRELEVSSTSDFDEAAKRIGDQTTPPSKPRRSKKKTEDGAGDA